MKKHLWIFIFFILIVAIGIFIFVKNKNSVNYEENYVANKTMAQINENETTSLDKLKNEFEPQNNVKEIKGNREEQIADFSTKLPKDTKARYSNIGLACETLNGTIVKTGETFSLWNVLGCPNKEKGYEKAKTFTSGGKITKSYGGGICQVSTTIYNAVLEVEELKIKERHEHSRDVVYIKDGKDAAVSYKSADLKFENTLGYDIKIESKLEDNNIKIKLIRI